MVWNWQLSEWPHFTFDQTLFLDMEKEFLLSEGKAGVFLKNIPKKDKDHFIVEILSLEGIKSARIEGEILDRESLQSSIRRHFGLPALLKKERAKETGMSMALIDVYQTYADPLDHSTLYRWHNFLFKDEKSLNQIGSYRTHREPMQIVSNKIGSEKVYFEAPPSIRIKKEMEQFLKWYNTFQGTALIKAAIAHVYFESIHPFEDGNGRIGRLIVEKILSQNVGRPILIAISRILELRKKEYYGELEKCNHTLNIEQWILFFSRVILEAQESSITLLEFLINKTKILTELTSQLNDRQLKALLRLFEEGPNGFKGGLSAENYISITRTSRATATRDLMDLVEKGALIKKGELKHTRYFINNNFG